MDLSRANKKEKHLLCSHRHTTVIAGPTFLIAHLLPPHDRAFSLLEIAQSRQNPLKACPDGKEVEVASTRAGAAHVAQVCEALLHAITQ